MQKGPFLGPDKGMSPDKREWTATSSGGLSFILKRSPRHLSEGSPPNTKGTKKYSAKKSRRDYLGTPFGITPSNYSQELLPLYLGNSFPLPRAKLLKHRSS